MTKRRMAGLAVAAAGLVMAGGDACARLPHRSDGGLSGLRAVATVSPRFQSYNIEMVEVTGGRFWAPYGGTKGEVYRMRPPIDLSSPRLRALARELGPVYLRVSGTWANNTYVPADGETDTAPPPGFAQVLKRSEWRGVVAFAKAVGARLVTSFAASAGTRGADGAWTPTQAQRLLDLTGEAGGRIAAAEFVNEPNITALGGLPHGYDMSQYAHDFSTFRDWARKASPDTMLLAPGTIRLGLAPGAAPRASAITGEGILASAPDALDGVSYHFYGGVSQRCAAFGLTPVRREDALSPAWLDGTLKDARYFAGLRDRYEPGKPLWLTETAQAACGGSPWAATFLDSFRYLNQLGALSQDGVSVVMHNTLAASDYALLDLDRLSPRPNYWAAVLWHRTMGTRVLSPPAPPAAGVRIYAHCLAGRPGGVGLVVLNPGPRAHRLALGGRASLWQMTAANPDALAVLVNGAKSGVDARGRLTGLDARSVRGVLALPAMSISFVAASSAGNPTCN